MRDLFNKKFLFLWLSQLFCQYADKFFIYVLLIKISEITGQSGLGVGLAAVAYGLPGILLSPIAGLIIDYLNRKFVLAITNFSRAGVILLVVLFPVFYQSFPLLFIATLINSSFEKFFIPAEVSSLPLIVKHKHLVHANSLFVITFYSSFVVAFGIAAPIVSLINFQFLLWISVAMYLIAGLFVLFIHFPDVHIRHKAFHPLHAFKDLLLGFKFIAKEFSMYFSLIVTFLISSIFSAISIQGIVYANKVLGLSQESFGYLVAAGGGGMIVGIIFINIFHYHIKRGALICSGLVFAGIFLSLFSRVTHFAYAATFLFLGGIGIAIVLINLQTLFQHHPPHHMLGRIMSTYNMTINSALAFAPLFIGHVVDLYGGTALAYQNTFYLLALFTLAMGVVGFLMPRYRIIS
ncbi:MFS transporter [Candidatus Margulisiibacteriota bacterium]